MSKQRTFSLRAEAACCIWECLLEWREHQHDDPTAALVGKLFETFGTVAMRHLAIALADLCCDVWDLFADGEIEDMDLIPYDWEFVPVFVKNIDLDAEANHSTDAAAIKAAMVKARKARAA
jgi:hypothetical protein